MWLSSFHAVLDRIDQNHNHTIIVFRSQCDTFCSGMDVSLVATMDEPERRCLFNEYVRLLQRLVENDKFSISLVEGDVFGGGLGLIASTDYVLAGRNHGFCLPEALLGIIPACIFPFLARRIGYQAAYRLSLTTQKIDVEYAFNISLVDKVSDDLKGDLRSLMNRVKYIDREIIGEMKNYFRAFNKIDQAIMDDAVNRIVRLTGERLFIESVDKFLD